MKAAFTALRPWAKYLGLGVLAVVVVSVGLVLDATGESHQAYEKLIIPALLLIVAAALGVQAKENRDQHGAASQERQDALGTVLSKMDVMHDDVSQIREDMGVVKYRVAMLEQSREDA